MQHCVCQLIYNTMSYCLQTVSLLACLLSLCGNAADWCLCSGQIYIHLTCNTYNCRSNGYGPLVLFTGCLTALLNATTIALYAAMLKPVTCCRWCGCSVATGRGDRSRAASWSCCPTVLLHATLSTPCNPMLRPVNCCRWCGCPAGKSS